MVNGMDNPYSPYMECDPSVLVSRHLDDHVILHYTDGLGIKRLGFHRRNI